MLIQTRFLLLPVVLLRTAASTFLFINVTGFTTAGSRWSKTILRTEKRAIPNNVATQLAISSDGNVDTNDYRLSKLPSAVNSGRNFRSVIFAISQMPLVVRAEDYEVADLPPPWIPIAFGIGLIVGVGLLTKSLGDVIDDESRLGMQSGARAKKEIERSRSSYFKKK